MATFSDRQITFISNRTKYIDSLKNPSEQQQIFNELAHKYLTNPDDLTPTEIRALKTLEAAERADERAAETKRAARKLISEQNEKARKERTHNMINAAGLMGLAGLLDTKTGKIQTTPERLLGALAELAKYDPTEQKKAEWDEIGKNLLAKKLPGNGF